LLSSADVCGCSWPGRAKAELKLTAVNQPSKAVQRDSERITRGRLWPSRADAAFRFGA
jgi:hypothetical protein